MESYNYYVARMRLLFPEKTFLSWEELSQETRDQWLALYYNQPK